MDLRPLAADMGYEGEPFVWDEDDRRHRLGRLDALFFHLYGPDRNDADYIPVSYTHLDVYKRQGYLSPPDDAGGAAQSPQTSTFEEYRQSGTPTTATFRQFRWM